MPRVLARRPGAPAADAAAEERGRAAAGSGEAGRARQAVAEEAAAAPRPSARRAAAEGAATRPGHLALLGVTLLSPPPALDARGAAARGGAAQLPLPALPPAAQLTLVGSLTGWLHAAWRGPTLLQGSTGAGRSAAHVQAQAPSARAAVNAVGARTLV